MEVVRNIDYISTVFVAIIDQTQSFSPRSLILFTVSSAYTDAELRYFGGSLPAPLLHLDTNYYRIGL